jgi:hypothetical protein
MPIQTFTATTQAEVFLKAMRADKTITCQDVKDYCEGFSSKVSTGFTIRDIAAGKLEFRWIHGCLARFGQSLSSEVRQLMIKQIDEPMFAFCCYRQFAFWTDTEDRILESIFKGKLPTAEKELADGVVTRAK